MMRRVAVGLLAALPLFAISSKQAVVGSQHDLTVTGTAPVKTTSVEACVFCHASHNVIPNVTPLWDQRLSSLTYSTYTSSTYSSGTQTPAAGSSKLCLSCHDGSVAVGLTVASGTIATSGAMKPIDVFGSNLSTGHPVSMIAANDGQLAATLFSSPATTKDPTVKLVSGKVECTTCHDPHAQNNDPSVPMFLVRANRGGPLCVACHDPSLPQPNQLNGWTTGAHAAATNTVPVTSSFGAYGTVSGNACSNCHGAHGNPVAPRNLRAAEEAACTPCHSGANVTPALVNIGAEFAKVYSHPTMTVSGVHDPTEANPVNSARHAECADCHNSHAAYAQTGTPVAPAIQASMSGVSGYDTAGAQSVAAKEYQVCLKCHGDSTNKPATSTYGRTAARYPQGPLPATYTPPPARPADQYNLRLKIQGTIGHNMNGTSIVTTANPSLRPFMLNLNGTNNVSRPLTSTTVLYCTDCHSNDQARSSGGTGPNGPHGSLNTHLLQLNSSQDAIGGGNGGGGGTAAALCNKCHNLSTVQNERPHNDHNGVSCSTCHDPHGVIGGNTSANRAMMNFDIGIAAKSTAFFGYFYNAGGTKGCYTTCHGENHNPHTY
jgi:predicted CXXCH cytochrome family protein